MCHVRPKVEHLTPIWSPFYLKDIDSIERVQRSFTKKIPGLSHMSYKERLQTLGIKSLEYRRLEYDLMLAYKILNNKINLEK